MTRPIVSGDGTRSHLSEGDLAEIGAIIYARTGMVFGESKRYYFERRVADLVFQSGAPSVRGYIGLPMLGRTQTWQRAE